MELLVNLGVQSAQIVHVDALQVHLLQHLRVQFAEDAQHLLGPKADLAVPLIDLRVVIYSMNFSTFTEKSKI